MLTYPSIECLLSDGSRELRRGNAGTACNTFLQARSIIRSNPQAIKTHPHMLVDACLGIAYSRFQKLSHRSSTADPVRRQQRLEAAEGYLKEAACAAALVQRSSSNSNSSKFSQAKVDLYILLLEIHQTDQNFGISSTSTNMTQRQSQSFFNQLKRYERLFEDFERAQQKDTSAILKVVRGYASRVPRSSTRFSGIFERLVMR